MYKLREYELEQKAIERANKTFDAQIKANNKKEDNDINPFYEDYSMHKELFNLTHNFTINDWRTIRTKKYYETIKGMSNYGKIKYNLTCVKYYIKNFLN